MLSCQVLSTHDSHFSLLLNRDCGEGWGRLGLQFLGGGRMWLYTRSEHGVGSNGGLSPLPAIPSTRSFLCHCCPRSGCGTHASTLTFPFSSILMCCGDLASTSVQLFMTPLPDSWPPSHTNLHLSLLLLLVSLSSSRWCSPLLSSHALLVLLAFFLVSVHALFQSIEPQLSSHQGSVAFWGQCLFS